MSEVGEAANQMVLQIQRLLDFGSVFFKAVKNLKENMAKMCQGQFDDDVKSYDFSSFRHSKSFLQVNPPTFRFIDSEVEAYPPLLIGSPPTRPSSVYTGQAVEERHCNLTWAGIPFQGVQEIAEACRKIRSLVQQHEKEEEPVQEDLEEIIYPLDFEWEERERQKERERRGGQSRRKKRNLCIGKKPSAGKKVVGPVSGVL